MRNKLVTLWSDLKGTRKLAKANELSLLSASLSFFCLFSVLPFFILCFLEAQFLMIHFTHSQDNLSELRRLIETMFPHGEYGLTEGLISVLMANRVVNWMGLGLLLFSTYELFGLLRTIFEKISTYKTVRHPLLTNFVTLLCFTTVSVGLAMAFLLFTTKTGLLRIAMGPLFWKLDLVYINVIAGFVSVTFIVGSLTFLFKVLPPQKISVRNALRGAYLFIGLFLTGRITYQFYAVYFKFLNEETYGRFFKPLLFLTWIYFLSHCFLFAAQYVIYRESKNR